MVHHILDIISSIRYVKNRYQEFQLKFLNAVNKIQVSQDASLLTTSQIVDKAIKNITIDKILGNFNGMNP